jgi:hypothetical protein
MDKTNPTLSFECSQCGEDIEEEDFELPGYDYGAEVHSDGRGTEYIDVTCPICKKQYNVEISNMFDQFEAEIPKEPSISVHISMPSRPDYDDWDYEEYLRSYVPSEPWDRYEHSLQLLDDMVSAAGALKSYPMFYRMLLLQHVAMMEAYLCDRLITLVEIEPVRVNLIKGYPNLQNQKYPLVALASNPNLIAEKTTTFLKAQLYHELDEVEKMYESALGSTPFVDEQSKTFLKSVMINRHHCVHRDGKDNDGVVLQQVDEGYIKEVREKVSALVKNIETKFDTEISKVRPELPF